MATVLMATPMSQAAELEKFVSSIPYPVAATNIAGAYAMTEMPKAADLRLAGPKTLLRHGIPYRRPNEHDRPAVQAVWAKVFERETPFQLIVPQLEVKPGRRHRLHRGMKTEDPVMGLNNWAGVYLQSDATTGPWASATGQFIIPTVSIPSEPAGVNGWESVIWVGMDGAGGGSNDVLQTGVEQTVDTSGNTTCSAWFEWVVGNPTLTGGVYSIAQNLVTLPDTTPMSPSLATVNGRLYLCWRSNGSDSMNVMVSNDGGQTFQQPPLVTADTSAQAPAVCEMNGNLYLAWKGDGNDNLNVAQVALDGNGLPIGLVNKVTLGDTSKSGPSLCSLNGMLYLAWRGEGNDLICIMRSSDGQTWSNQHVSSETTPTTPALGVCNGQLFTAWQGDGNDQLNVAAVALDNTNAPTALTNVNTLAITSSQAPALAGLNGFLYLSFMGDNGDELYVYVSEDEGNTFAVGHGSSETSPSGPAMAVANGQMVLAWRGSGNNLLNVAPILANFNTYPYVYQTNIINFPVSPGDSITASVNYVGNSSGVVQLANHNTNQAFSLTLLPPPGASFNGQWVEWILETPSFQGGTVFAILPSFTPLTFTQAFGCGSKAVANPSAGLITEVAETVGTVAVTVTSTTQGDDTLTVTFTG